MRKRCHRRVVVPLPPRALRPKLVPEQVRDLALAHIVNLDLIARGEGTAEVMWQMAGGVLTWSRVAFTGPEYQAAKRGVQVMDELAEIVDRPTAVIAAEWSEARVNAMAAVITPHPPTTTEGTPQCEEAL